jgi:molybdopterin-guanine dinucleotide biosynthesis protein A
MPFLTAEIVRFLAVQPGTAVPVVGGRQQPLCARYGAGAGPVAIELVAAGARAMTALLDRLSVTWLDEGAWSGIADDRAFADIDTPADLTRLGLDAGGPPGGERGATG